MPQHMQPGMDPAQFQVLLQGLKGLIHSMALDRNSRMSRTNEGAYRLRAPDFDGMPRGLPVQSWFDQLEQGFAAENIYSDHRRIGYAVNWLRGAALEWWRARVRDSGDFTRWTDFTLEVKKAFEEPNLQHSLRHRWRHPQPCHPVSKHRWTNPRHEQYGQGPRFHPGTQSRDQARVALPGRGPT